MNTKTTTTHTQTPYRGERLRPVVLTYMRILQNEVDRPALAQFSTVWLKLSSISNLYQIGFLHQFSTNFFFFFFFSTSDEFQERQPDKETRDRERLKSQSTTFSIKTSRKEKRDNNSNMELTAWLRVQKFYKWCYISKRKRLLAMTFPGIFKVLFVSRPHSYKVAAP